MSITNSSLKTYFALGVFFCAAILSLTREANAASDTRVDTAAGAVQGFIKDGVAEFLGIPYAAPPVGQLRWRPPVPHASWSGVRDATQFGNICLQVTTLGPFAGPANANEDCLYLNVYSPNVHPAAATSTEEATTTTAQNSRPRATWWS